MTAGLTIFRWTSAYRASLPLFMTQWSSGRRTLGRGRAGAPCVTGGNTGGNTGEFMSARRGASWLSVAVRTVCKIGSGTPLHNPTHHRTKALPWEQRLDAVGTELARGRRARQDRSTNREDMT